MSQYKPIEQRHPLRIVISLLITFVLIIGILCSGFISATVFAADTTLALGPKSGAATFAMLRAGTPPSDHAIEDEYGTIWGTSTQVDIFKVEYENGTHEVTVAGKNNEKVIAPGTENTYTFAVKNIAADKVDYKIIVEAFITGLDGTGKTIPVQARLLGQQGWMVGGDTEYRPVLELDGAEESAILFYKQHATYTLQWQWPFEQDLNGDGNIDDGDELDTWLASQNQDFSLTIRITALTSPRYFEDPAVLAPIPPSLNGEDHMAYLYGDDHSLVRPNDNITRAEVAAMIYRMLKDDVRNEYETRECAYTDVEEDAWYRIEVATLSNMGFLKGYPDGTFCGDDEISRAEFATILARISEQEISEEGKTKFLDIKDHWAVAEIMTIEDFNWIEGYPDGNFYPLNSITRAETVTMLNRVLHRLPEQLSDLLPDMVTWPDNMDTETWYYLAIQEASNSHTYIRLLGTREKWVELHEIIELGKE